MMKKQAAFVLRARDRIGLEGILRNGNVPQKIVKRAKIVLMTADGAGVMTIMRAVGVSKTTVWRWQDYFVEAGLTGLVKGRTTPPGFAAIFLLGVIGTVLFVLVDVAERLVCPWHVSHRLEQAEIAVRVRC